MSNLEVIVSPLELCKLISAGEFEDSALVWHITNYGEIIIEPRHKKHNFLPQSYPAPTLAEILAALPKTLDLSTLMIYPTFDDDGDGWQLSYDENTNEKDSNPAAAALRLWLKLRGMR